MTETELELIPREWQQVLDDNPGDFNLLAALADYLADKGDDLGSEAIRWAVEKRRFPDDNGCWDVATGKGFPDHPCDLPDPLFHITDSQWNWTAEMSRFYTWSQELNKPGHRDWQRLIFRWKLASPKLRQDCWNWNPAA